MSRLSTVLLLLSLLVLFACVASSQSHRHARLKLQPVKQSVTAAPASTYNGSVYYKNDQYSYTAGVIDPAAVATATFKDGLNVTGWGELWVTTNSNYDDSVQMYAAGFLEGIITANRIIEMHDTMAAQVGPVAPKVAAFINNQTDWVLQSVKANPTDSRWQGVGLIMQQYAGLVAGYNTYPVDGRTLTRLDFDVLNLDGDWGDIETAVNREHRPDFSHMTPQQILQYKRTRDHCSVLVKLTGDLQEIYAAHSTWNEYDQMNRIFKHYHFQLNSPFVAAKKVSFSSYPGYLESLDDFYYMDSGLVMLETTNSVFNMSLFDLVTPQSLFAWQRVRLASQNAHTGQEWYEHVAWYNSGTYNNQYAILDFKLYRPGRPLVPNTLWVMEQIPGLVVGGDQTALLTFGYFPSYNVPFFQEIYNKSGYVTIAERMDGFPGFDYQNAPRAMIFRRDQGTVTNLTTFQHIMRYNDYQHDPIAGGDPFSAICSRGDFDGQAFGWSGMAPALDKQLWHTDTKVTSFSLYQQGIAYIVNGPTTNGGTLPPFSWSKFPGVVHSGQPEVFDFGFIPTQWSTTP